MKTGKIRLAGQDRVLCFSTRVVLECTERYGDVEKIGDVLSDSDIESALRESLWLLERMMRAGARYCALNGEKCAEPLTVDDMLDLCGVDDFRALKESISETITNSAASSVEAKSKNAEATQDELKN